jgi:hypothetical protein
LGKQGTGKEGGDVRERTERRRANGSGKGKKVEIIRRGNDSGIEEGRQEVSEGDKRVDIA